MWKNKSEINKVYMDHFDSLEMWGGDWDPEAVKAAWLKELEAFDKE